MNCTTCHRWKRIQRMGGYPRHPFGFCRATPKDNPFWKGVGTEVLTHETHGNDCKART